MCFFVRLPRRYIDEFYLYNSPTRRQTVSIVDEEHPLLQPTRKEKQAIVAFISNLLRHYRVKAHSMILEQGDI